MEHEYYLTFEAVIETSFTPLDVLLDTFSAAVKLQCAWGSRGLRGGGRSLGCWYSECGPECESGTRALGLYFSKGFWCDGLSLCEKKNKKKPKKLLCGVNHWFPNVCFVTNGGWLWKRSHRVKINVGKAELNILNRFKHNLKNFNMLIMLCDFPKRTVFLIFQIYITHWVYFTVWFI